ncbi:MAG: DUF4433 domain-containing protein [Candidatus Heimdallarchaeaceae archaeon]
MVEKSLEKNIDFCPRCGILLAKYYNFEECLRCGWKKTDGFDFYYCPKCKSAICEEDDFFCNSCKWNPFFENEFNDCHNYVIFLCPSCKNIFSELTDFVCFNCGWSPFEEESEIKKYALEIKYVREKCPKCKNEILSKFNDFYCKKCNWSLYENYLRYYNIGSLYYITHINNLESILANGIFSRNRCIQNNINFKDISNREVQYSREYYHSYVPLFFADNTPMLYTVIEEYKENVVLLELENEIMLLDGVKISDGNVASTKTKIFSEIFCLNKLDWEIIDNRSPAFSPKWKRIRSAEILVPDYINPLFIKAIHVQDEAINRYIKKEIKDFEYQPKIKIDLTEKGIV